MLPIATVLSPRYFRVITVASPRFYLGWLPLRKAVATKHSRHQATVTLGIRATKHSCRQATVDQSIRAPEGGMTEYG